jgi:PAS domain S-box-containing protein
MKRVVGPDRAGSLPLSGATGGGAAAVVAAALDAIVVIDQRGRILDFNPAAERMFGHLRAEVLERDVADVIIPPEMRQRHRDGMARHLRTGTTTILDRPVEMLALRADGSRFPIELSIVRFDQAGTPTFTAFIRDITESRRLLDALRRHSSRLTAIVRAQQELADAGLTPPELRARIASAAQSVFGGDGAAFELIEEAQFVYRAASGIAAAHEGLRLPLDASLSGLALRTRRALASQDTAIDPRVDQAQCRAVGIRSLVVAPVFLLQRPAGILKVMSTRAGAFDTDDANALELFAASIGTILQRGEHEQERQRTALMRERIAAAQQEIAASGETLEPLLARVAAQVQALLGADGALLLRPRDGALEIAAASGCVAGEAHTRLPLEGSFALQCLQQTGVLRCEAGSAGSGEAALWSRCGVRSALGAALRAQEETFGVLQVLSRRPDSSSEHDAHDLHLLVEALGAALQRREAAARLRRSEQQYRMLFDHNPHPMWVYEVGTLRFLAVNLAAEQAYGFSREEFLGMTLRDIRPAEDVPALEAQLAGIPEHRTFRSLRRHRRRDGTLIDAEVTSDPILFEDRQARLVMAHDVTARLRAEAGQASANRAQRILSACTSAMIRIGDEKRLLEEICRIIVEIGGYRLAGVGYAQDDAERSLLPMAAAGMHAEHVGRIHLRFEHFVAQQAGGGVVAGVEGELALHRQPLALGPQRADAEGDVPGQFLQQRDLLRLRVLHMLGEQAEEAEQRCCRTTRS